MLILAHGLFVAGEFAIVTVDRAQMERLAREGHRGAQSALAAVRTLSFQLSGAQLGITVTSLIVGFIAEPTIGRAIEPVLTAIGLPRASVPAVAITVALGLATALEMVIGELVPKNLAIAEPQSLALRTATPLRWFNRVFKGVIVFLNSSANWTVRRLGIEPREELAAVRSLEELQMLVHSSRAEGLLPEADFSLLDRSFTFGDKTADDALVPRTSVAALGRAQTLSELAEVALETGHSRFPVYTNDLDDIIGVAHVHDLFRVPFEERATTRVTEVIRPAITVPESRSLGSLLVEMRRERQHLAIVLDEYGGTSGIITLEDLLEEIVGDIEDEHDPARAGRPRPPTGIEVLSGMLHRDEVREACGFEMPEGDYETLAGFLLWLLRRIPEQGDHATYRGWEFKVVEMDGRRIASVLAVAPPPPPDEDEEA
ncbi:MAG TPA: hemolysin family protein [Actinomycetota bacterium]|nr:hemolysin family protein [Actinomycetota bacterium]